jgi:hypothetical protein
MQQLPLQWPATHGQPYFSMADQFEGRVINGVQEPSGIGLKAHYLENYVWYDLLTPLSIESQHYFLNIQKIVWNSRSSRAGNHKINSNINSLILNFYKSF